MDYMISTPKRDAERAARAQRKEIARGIFVALVLVACILAASYGDTISGVNPSPAAAEAAQ